MDEEKKSSGSNDMATEITLLLVGVFMLSVVVARFENFLRYLGYNSLGSAAEDTQNTFLTEIWPTVQFTAYTISVIALFGIAFYIYKLNQIVKEERQVFGNPDWTLFEDKIGQVFDKKDELPKNDKWERIISLINSPNSTDWRLAIIEADVMLDEVLRLTGHYGDTIGEMLKGVDPGDLKTLQNAWDAHKVRNQIAHAGVDFELSDRLAKVTINNYEAVFKEFKII